MNEIWLSDPIAIAFAGAGLGIVTLAFWFIKMDLHHRPKRLKKAP